MPAPTDAPDPAAVDALERARVRLRAAQAICAAEPQASFENVWHTLILLEESPVDRLNRSLVRGRATAIQR